VKVGGAAIGGPEIVIMAGPCSVEDEDGLMSVARHVASSGARILRGGAFKPRSSPYSFRGLAEEGLQILAEVRERTGLAVITEVMSSEQLPLVSQYADILQIGTRNMHNFTLLHEVGLPGKEQEAIIDSLWEAHQKVGLWAMAIDDSLRVVDALRETGYRLAVVSNAEGQVARDLDNAGYHGRFETVVDSALVGVEKPDPRIFEIALGRLKLEPDQVIYVGDVPAIDVAGARAAGIAAVLVDPHEMYAGEDVPRIRRLAELPGLLAGD